MGYLGVVTNGFAEEQGRENLILQNQGPASLQHHYQEFRLPGAIGSGADLSLPSSSLCLVASATTVRLTLWLEMVILVGPPDSLLPEPLCPGAVPNLPPSSDFE